MFDFLKKDKSISHLRSFEGTAYCAVIQEDWFPSILAGEVGYLTPWKTPQGYVYPVFALDEKITSMEHTFIEVAQTEKKIMCGVRLNKNTLDNIKNGLTNINQDFPTNYPIQTMFVLTPKTLSEIWTKFDSVSDDEHFLILNSRQKRNLIVAKGILNDKLFQNPKVA